MTDQHKHFGRIGVLMGGVSSEREISLKSGNAVTQALQSRGCHAVALDIVTAEEGGIATMLEGARIDLAFVALHGRLGEDGVIQSILETSGIVYTGSGPEASCLAFNKVLAQKVFKENSIPIAPYVIVTKKGFVSAAEIIGALETFPIVVKPACEGSSIGVSIVGSENELHAALECAWQYGETALAERFIQGKELTVGILGEEALPVIEIRPKRGFFDYKAKYTLDMTDYILPADISEELSTALQQCALRAHRALGCADLSRVDFMLDAGNAYYVLEINTIPGFTATSLLPKAARQRGIGFEDLCLRIAGMAYGKKKEIGNAVIHH